MEHHAMSGSINQVFDPAILHPASLGVCRCNGLCPKRKKPSYGLMLLLVAISVVVAFAIATRFTSRLTDRRSRIYHSLLGAAIMGTADIILEEPPRTSLQYLVLAGLVIVTAVMFWLASAPPKSTSGQDA